MNIPQPESFLLYHISYFLPRQEHGIYIDMHRHVLISTPSFIIIYSLGYLQPHKKERVLLNKMELQY